jgi:hypothetical protein
MATRNSTLRNAGLSMTTQSQAVSQQATPKASQRNKLSSPNGNDFSSYTRKCEIECCCCPHKKFNEISEKGEELARTTVKKNSKYGKCGLPIINRAEFLSG